MTWESGATLHLLVCHLLVCKRTRKTKQDWVRATPFPNPPPPSSASFLFPATTGPQAHNISLCTPSASDPRHVPVTQLLVVIDTPAILPHHLLKSEPQVIPGCLLPQQPPTLNPQVFVCPKFYSIPLSPPTHTHTAATPTRPPKYRACTWSASCASHL